MGTLALDKTFKLTGKLIDSSIPGDDIATSIIVQADGKIITAGMKNVQSSSDFYLLRYNRDGSNDLAFNSAVTASTPSLIGLQERSVTTIVQKDNFLYVVGTTAASSLETDLLKVFVAKYSLDGSLQSVGVGAFGGALGSQPGFSVVGDSLDNYEALGAVVQSDGKIIVSGSVKRTNPLSATAEQDLLLIRFTASGALDTTFGDGTGSARTGKFTIDIGNGDTAISVKLQKIGSEERILVVGSTASPSQALPPNAPKSDFMLLRLTTSGDVDNTFGFGGAGRVTTPITSSANPNLRFEAIAKDAVILKDGKILVVGQVSITSGGVRDVAVVRYLANGGIDASFGTEGRLVIDASTLTGGDDFAFKVVQDASGKIIILGSATGVGSGLDTALIRLNADGTRDQSFGNNGVQLTAVDSGVNEDLGLALAISPQDNSIVIAGGSAPPKPPTQPGQISENPPGDSFIVKYESEQPKVLNGPDFNGDGNRDLLWRDKNNGTAKAWFLDGITKIGEQNFSPTLNDQNWQIVGTGDFNNDGKDDLLWRNSLAGVNVVWYMNGTTQIGQSNITYNSGDPALLTGSAWQIKGVADFNKDGFDDILWRTSSAGINVVWYLGGANGTTLIDTRNVGPQFVGTWDIQAINDFDRDGFVDIFWREAGFSGVNAVWYLGGAAGNDLVATQSITIESNLDWQVVGSGDFTKDGDADLLWRNLSSGSTRVWEMQGTAYRGVIPINSSENNTWKLQSGGDFNGDGQQDFLWRNQVDGTAKTWFLDGTTKIGERSFSPTLNDQNWQIAGTGDFNNDGKDDLLWRNSLAGVNVVWYMDGTAQTGQRNITYNSGDPALLTGSAWQIKGIADFNKDGFDDILWRTSSAGVNVVWYLGGTNGTTLIDTKNVGPQFVGSWDIQAVDDFDQDGSVDIFWREAGFSGVNAIWYLGGAAGNDLVATDSVVSETDLSWQVVGSGDFTKDGDADLLWRNSVTGVSRVWEMQGTSFRATNAIVSPLGTGFSLL